MSRLEKKIHKKLKRRKIKVVFKVLFILAMITNLSICIFIIDKSAKEKTITQTSPNTTLSENFDYSLKENKYLKFLRN